MCQAADPRCPISELTMASGLAGVVPPRMLTPGASGLQTKPPVPEMHCPIGACCPSSLDRGYSRDLGHLLTFIHLLTSFLGSVTRSLGPRSPVEGAQNRMETEMVPHATCSHRGRPLPARLSETRAPTAGCPGPSLGSFRPLPTASLSRLLPLAPSQAQRCGSGALLSALAPPLSDPRPQPCFPPKDSSL